MYPQIEAHNESCEKSKYRAPPRNGVMEGGENSKSVMGQTRKRKNSRPFQLRTFQPSAKEKRRILRTNPWAGNGLPTRARGGGVRRDEKTQF